MAQEINRLFHVCIAVPDIEKALEFYQGVLGLQSVGSLRNEKSDGAMLGFPGEEIEIHANHLCGKQAENATVIDLIEFVNPTTDVDEGPYRRMNQVGITRIAFDVDDADAIYERLRAHGDIEILSEPATVQAPTDGFFRIVTFKDPHGIVLEAIEHRLDPLIPTNRQA
ncbi:MULTISPECIES: VOC family protein [Micrococcaceae]|uniref:VOC family protein n=1 Tax=unclassified Kocuria TaxID=2649579 RepID=UPI0010134B4F|nr:MULTISPECIES: VOC family protein [unclassified Kocuria]